MNIIAATSPWRFEDDYTIVYLKVWFTEFEHPFESYGATMFDCEPHGRELWFRAMKGEYGPIEVHERPIEIRQRPVQDVVTLPPNDIVRMLTYDNAQH